MNVWNWVKKNKQVVANALIIALLMANLGLRVENAPASNIESVGQKVIKVGYYADAAGAVDFTYNGTNDNVAFQNALNALPSSGGMIIDVSGVTKHFSATVTRAIGNVTIVGTGRGSYFTNNGAAVIFQPGGNNWVFKDMAFDSLNGINQGVTTGWIEENIWLGTLHYAFRSTDGETVAGNLTTNNAYVTSLNMSGDVLPTTNNTRSLGSSILKWLTGWFVNLNAETINATQVNGVTGNFSTLNAPTVNITDVGHLYYIDIYGTQRNIIQMGGVPTSYGYQSAIYMGIDNGNPTSNASFQGAFGISSLASTDNLSEGNWAFGDVVFGTSTNLTYSQGFGDGAGTWVENSSRLVLIGDHVIYNALHKFSGFDLNIVGGGAGANLSIGYRSEVMGRAAVNKVTDLHDSVIFGWQAGQNLTGTVAGSILIGVRAAPNMTSASNQLWIGDGQNGNGLPLIGGRLPNSDLQFYVNTITARSSDNSTYGTFKGMVNFVSDIGTTGNGNFHTASVNSSWVKFQSYNETSASQATVATLWGGTIPFFDFTLPPRYSVTNSTLAVVGPSNTTNVVKWVKVLDSDNTTGWYPMYK